MGLGFSVYGIQFECCTSSAIASAVNIIMENNKNLIANA
jgi:hypothetical protein